jgi:hypothetical protein
MIRDKTMSTDRNVELKKLNEMTGLGCLPGFGEFALVDFG